MSKQLLLLLTLLTLPFYNVKSEEAFYTCQTFYTQEPSFFLHTVERGQTVYSISVMYNVSVEDIYKLNPASRVVIRIGDTLKIPQESGSYLYHTIQPKETLYGLAQKYFMKGEDIIAANPGLSVETFLIGKIIRIPTNMVTTPIEGGNEDLNRLKTNSLLSRVFSQDEVNTINIALLLPFGLKENLQTKNLMVEYLEGFLMAINVVKKAGVSVNLQVYDIGAGTGEISTILKNGKMKEIHLLIGGLYDNQIRMLSRFSKENGISYVIPFTSQTDEPFNNPNIFQVNMPQSNRHSKASYGFIKKYAKDNIIIVTDETGANNKSEFIDCLTQDLQDKNIPYQTVSLGGNFQNSVKGLLSSYQNNVIVPSDDSTKVLSKMIPALKNLLDSQPNLSLTLFGYPAWQVYSARYSNDFARLNATFYAYFYSDPNSSDAKTFYSNFYKTYSRRLGDTFPKYGMLGYDTGLYFIRLINNFGSHFGDRVNDLRYTGIQSDFYFERLNNWSGFINTNLYMVNYNSDNSITKSFIK